jgi:hypothetical protein
MITKFFWLLTSVSIAAIILTGCQSPHQQPPTESNPSLSTRNNCYSLLHQLLEQEKDDSFLRFFKSEETDVKNLVNKIAKTSGTGSKLLEKFAKEDPSIRLDDLRLPPGEVATRDAIAATEKKELLGKSGEPFELALLLTQTEALNYAWHLAKVASENEPQPDHARALAGISQDMENLYHEEFALLLSKAK